MTLHAGVPPLHPYHKPDRQAPTRQGSSGRPQRPGSGRRPRTGGRPDREPLRAGQANTGPARWVLALAVFAAVMGASLSLHGVVQNFGWFPRAAVVVAATLLPPAMLRRRLRLGPFAPLGAVAGWIIGLTLVYFPSTAVLGAIPTYRTLQAALELASQASSVIMGSVAPAPTVLPMMFLISAGLGFVALLIDTLALTVAMPAASSLGIVLVMLPAALMTKTGLGPLAFLGAGTGFLLILGCCRWYAPGGRLRMEPVASPSGTLSRAAAMGAAVVLLTALVPALLPGFNQGAFPQGTRLDAQEGPTRLDPMISLGEDLREQSSRVNLSYLSNTNTAQYIRMNTLEDFTGKAWRPSPLPVGLKPGMENLAPAQDVDPAIPRTEILTWITPSGLRSDWLPAPAGTNRVEELGGNWRWNPDTATIKGAGSTTEGQSYVVHSSVPELTPERLAAATAKPSPELAPVFTELPANVPKIVADTAREVAGKEATPYAKAMALQKFLRSSAFSYSLETPAEEGYDGSGMEVLESFLKAKRGYCVHFSAAMAVMARELLIPSRIAVGYSPGADNLNVAERDGVALFGYQATGRDAHAWPELYFEGVGWVPFEPTPSRGSVPDYARPEAVDAPSAVLPSAAATTTAPTPTPTVAESTPAAGPGAAVSGVDHGRWLLGTAAGLLLALVLAAPGLLRSNVRRRRLARVRTPSMSVESLAPENLAWRELMDTAVDYGYVQDPALTPALHAEKISAMLGPANPPGLTLLLRAFEQSSYGAAAADAPRSTAGREDLAEAVNTVAGRLQSRATPWGRLRARWVPASLFRR